jgi:SAM-dependent methyltransferase
MTLEPERARNLVRRSYDQLGKRYSDWVGENADPVRQRYLQYVLADLPLGSKVLDLGCGDGSLITVHLARDHQVTGVDISCTQLERAGRTIPNAQFICGDITSVHLPENCFDAIVAFYCLTHVPQQELPLVIAHASDWLRPGGLFVGSFGVNDEQGTVQDDWLGVPMFFSGCRPETNRQILTETGLLIEQDRVETVEEFDQTVRFHWIIARKPGQ